MIPAKIQDVVQTVMEDLSQGKFEALVARLAASRLSAEQLRQVIREYGRTPISPPVTIEPELDVVQVQGASPPTWSVRSPLWTREEGRSDLTLELTVTTDRDAVRVELDDLHVL
jgi:hypothetical protein